MKKTLFIMILGLMMLSSMESYANIASGTSGTCKWTINDSGVLTVEPQKGTEGTLGDWDFGSPWSSNSWDITKVIIKNKVIAKTCKNMFTGSSNVTSIDLTGLDTKNVESMANMFKDCRNLKDLDVSKLNTSNVKDMFRMFYKCLVLPSLNLSSWKTSKVVDMYQMFYSCHAIKTLNLSSFNTSNVRTMEQMFEYCEELTTLDLTNFNTQKAETMYMFNGSDKITSITSSAVTPSSLAPATFKSLSTLSKCKLFVPAASVAKYKAADGWKNLIVTAIATNTNIAEGTSGTCKWTIDKNGLLTIQPQSGTIGKLGNWNSMSPWFNNTNDIKKVVFKNKVSATTCNGLFGKCRNLTSIDFTGFDTQSVTNMYAMFSSCSSLKTLDLSNLNTSNVTDMAFMFSECKALTSINVSKFNTSKVTDMKAMFQSCYALTSLDLSSFNTSMVTNMENMFNFDSALKTLKLGNFATSKASVSSMFNRCNALTTIYATAATPATMKAETFDTLPTLGKCKLQVPNASLAKYKAAAGWKKLLVVTADIEDIAAPTNNSKQTPVYNLNGQRVSGNAKGIVIINGKKVFVK